PTSNTPALLGVVFAVLWTSVSGFPFLSLLCAIFGFLCSMSGYGKVQQIRSEANAQGASAPYDYHGFAVVGMILNLVWIGSSVVQALVKLSS
ncbi:MAG: hypothetical protein KDB07_05640, partial [Planctomycetes bacterium]|nr:hypothetical protein [Planctomycetota bacterium]